MFTLWLSLIPLDDSGVTAARNTLSAVARKHERLTALSAVFVQERSSLLLKDPIRSQGRLYFRKKPGCLLLRTTAPNPTVMRLDERTYEVYRPEKKQLEKFPLESQEWPRAIFQTFSHEMEELEKNFELLSSSVEKPDTPSATRRIRMKATTEKVRERLTSLTISIRLRDHLVTAIAYTDPQGDTVTISLNGIAVDPELTPDIFELDPAEGTQVIVHEGD